MNRRTRRLISLLFLAVLVGVPVFLTWRAARQQQLDRALIAAVKERNADAVVSLLREGANANAREHKDPPLSFKQIFLNLFLPHRRPNGAAQEPGETALLLAVTPHRDEYRPVDSHIIGVLLDANASPHCRNAHHDTPLHYAVFICPSEVRHLLEKGAEVNARDDDGSTPLMGTYTPSVARLLLDKGADLQAKDRHGDFVLFHLLKLEFALRTAGLEQAFHIPGLTPIDTNEVPLLRLLLERGAEVNARDSTGRTALMWAGLEGNVEVAAALLKGHADINARDNQGQTTYTVARQQGRWKLANLLMRAGAKE